MDDENSMLFQISYHPVSIVLPSAVGHDSITGISCAGSLTTAEFREWIDHIGKRIQILESASISYRQHTVETDADPSMEGVVDTSGGLRISFNTGSDFIDTMDAAGTVISRSVLAELFPKGYKMLYDSEYGGC